MWNKTRSLMLSKISVFIFIGMLIAGLVSAPWLVQWLMRISVNAQEAPKALFFATLYTGGGLAGVLLCCLYALLHNIGKGLVFTWKNIKILRTISWLCIAVGIACTVSTFYYFPWLIAGIAAAFIGLVVRVVKNIMAEATALKEENDFTI